MKIKICGITNTYEADYLNEAEVDYAGFVFYEKSKRNISLDRAEEIFSRLAPSIKKVAVMVSPDADQIKTVQSIDFDIIQIHRDLNIDVLKEINIPVWYAVNIEDENELNNRLLFLNGLEDTLKNKIEAIVVDSKNFGSGKTFNWRKSKRLKKAGTLSPPSDDSDNNFGCLSQMKFVLAGGLNSDNVREGISIFSPDIVDVSSGVEGEQGKDKQKILDFVNIIRN